MYDTIRKMAQEYRNKANNHRVQTSYDAGWLHGYATALENLLNSPEELREIAWDYAHGCLLEDAARQLALYFGIDPDSQDEEDDPDAWQKCTDALGFSFDEACNESGEHYILDKLVERFEHDKDCNTPINSTWETVIAEFSQDMSKKGEVE